MSDIEPLVLDPGGWPNVVAAGELVESAWGNAVVGALSQGIHHELFYSSAESGDITTTPVAATTVSLATYTGHLYSIRGYLSAIARTGTVSYAIVRLTVNGAVANTLPVTLFASNVPANADLSITWKATTTATATFVHDVAQASYSPNAVRFVIDNAHPRGLTIFDHGIAP